jgi:hypothetical protein
LLPFDVGEVSIDVSKHLRNTWMRKWDWDQFDLREGLREAYKVSTAGKGKWELLTRKTGERKLVMVYDEQTEEVFVIIGTEG